MAVPRFDTPRGPAPIWHECSERSRRRRGPGGRAAASVGRMTVEFGQGGLHRRNRLAPQELRRSKKLVPRVKNGSVALHRYHGAVVFGADARGAVDDIIASPHVAGVVTEQHLTCTAVHVYVVDRTVPVIRMNPGS
jgi:hypothetical protein